MIYFKKRRDYKYNLHADVVFETEQKVPQTKDLRFLVLQTNGSLLIKKGYAWDGPSGPTVDTNTFMRGSLVHDALYQLMREGVLPRSYRKRADEILREMCVQDGMNRIRAWWVYHGVRLGGGSSVEPELLTAP